MIKKAIMMTMKLLLLWRLLLLMLGLRGVLEARMVGVHSDQRAFRKIQLVIPIEMHLNENIPENIHKNFTYSNNSI